MKTPENKLDLQWILELCLWEFFTSRVLSIKSEQQSIAITYLRFRYQFCLLEI